MACGCGKAMRNTTRGAAVIGPIRQASTRPISQNISIQGVGGGFAPNNVNNTSPMMAGMDEERRRIEKLRRDAIKKALNK